MHCMHTLHCNASTADTTATATTAAAASDTNAVTTTTTTTQACGVYHLTVVNDMAQWPAPEGMMNTMHDPSFTNLHTHGLHISGDAPADDVATLIGPGESYEYTYTVPCDHSGGTNWYHPHKHGSSALQVMYHMNNTTA
jgi:FtsP/CotA-like multicopper oxidase with cupredoxin domain